MKRSKLILGLTTCVIMVQSGCNPESAYKAPPPPKVTVVKPDVETIPIYLEENGETESVEQAVVQARVRGVLEKILFEPDSEVTEGMPLYQIEKQEYQAKVDSASATVESAKAELESALADVDVAKADIDAAIAAVKVAELEYSRIYNLRESNAVSKSELDLAEGNVSVSKAAQSKANANLTAKNAEITNAKAKVSKALSDLKNAELKLNWTDIQAPISGWVTKTKVKRGNMVEDGTVLTEVIQNRPIWANFNISERFLLHLERESNRQTDNTIDPTNIVVQLKRSGDDGFPFEGHLDYYERKIDQDTGTLQLRAVFENKRGNKAFLLPGLFVRVRMQIGESQDALLIPERAIGRDQVGAFVYVVGGDKKAVRKNVQLGIKHEGKIVVESGLDATDSVVVDGIQRVRPGVEVDPS